MQAQSKAHRGKPGSGSTLTKYINIWMNTIKKLQWYNSLWFKGQERLTALMLNFCPSVTVVTKGAGTLLPDFVYACAWVHNREVLCWGGGVSDAGSIHATFILTEKAQTSSILILLQATEPVHVVQPTSDPPRLFPPFEPAWSVTSWTLTVCLPFVATLPLQIREHVKPFSWAFFETFFIYINLWYLQNTLTWDD